MIGYDAINDLFTNDFVKGDKKGLSLTLPGMDQIRQL
jgi:hypothetical protein